MNNHTELFRSLLAENPALEKVTELYPYRTTPYYESLVNKDNISEDPVFKQFFPDLQERDEQSAFQLDDPLCEEAQMPVKHLIHRYNDRAVLLTTNACAVFCRFCMRKRKWQNNQQTTKITEEELASVVSYLHAHSEIRELLISGGDPLMLTDRELQTILNAVSKVSSLQILRIGTRIPVVLPSRVDEDLAELFAGFRGLWVATHFNHPNELTHQALKACSLFINKGVPVVNQTVLLKGINDNFQVLEKLFSTLAANRIKPLYLFHIDPVAGNEHFATGIEKGKEIMEALRNRISSIATPVFAIDLPDGEGKVPITPDYTEDNNTFKGLSGKFIKYIKKP